MKKIILYFPAMLILLGFMACNNPSSKDEKTDEKDMSKLAYVQFTANGETILDDIRFDDMGYSSGSVNGGERILSNMLMVFDSNNKRHEKLHVDVHRIADDLNVMDASELSGKTYPVDFTSEQGYKSGDDVKLTIERVEERGESEYLGTLYRAEGKLEGSVTNEAGETFTIKNGKAAIKLYQK
ncbi:MAG TPA: hypothetical protein VJ946_09710 [Bacteroidales bacterium]|nr:hypothetical protein [Bacteroidales bacterium]